MDHFGMALGVITVTVVGGAVVFDRSVADKEIVQPAPHAAVAQSQPGADAAASIDPATKPAGTSNEAPVASLEVQPRTQPSDVKLAPARKPAATRNTVVASAPTMRVPKEAAPAVKDPSPAPMPAPAAAPAPALAPVEAVPATPAASASAPSNTTAPPSE